MQFYSDTGPEPHLLVTYPLSDEERATSNSFSDWYKGVSLTDLRKHNPDLPPFRFRFAEDVSFVSVLSILALPTRDWKAGIIGKLAFAVNFFDPKLQFE